MKKSLILVALLALFGVSNAQYFRTYNVPVWQGPGRLYLAGGYLQQMGCPDFTEYGSGGKTITPDAFKNQSGLAFSAGIDLLSGETGIAVGPYMHIDYYKDGWSADFNSELPTGYNPLFIYHYDMTSNVVGGAMGGALYYHFSDRITVGFGAALNGRVGIGTKYTSTATNKLTGVVSTYNDSENILSDDINSNPFDLAIELKGDVVVFLADNFYMGLLARYDAKPFYCSLDDTPNYVGSSLMGSNNHRNRLMALLTIGLGL